MLSLAGMGNQTQGVEKEAGCKQTCLGNEVQRTKPHLTVKKVEGVLMQPVYTKVEFARKWPFFQMDHFPSEAVRYFYCLEIPYSNI